MKLCFFFSAIEHKTFSAMSSMSALIHNDKTCFRAWDFFLKDTSNLVTHGQRLDVGMENDSLQNLPLRI